MIGRLSRIAALVVAAAAFLGGVPWLLAATAGWPLPTSVPNWNNVYWAVRQSDIQSGVVIKSCACIAWLAWGQLLWAIVWELAVNVPRLERGQRPRRAPLTFAPIALVAGRGVAVALALVTTATPSVASAPSLTTFAAGAAIAAPQTSTAFSEVAAASAREAVADAAVWRVQFGDSLWDIAESCLGDGSRVDDIIACNPGLDPARRLRPGQRVLLPDDARVPVARTQRVDIDLNSAIDTANTGTVDEPSELALPDRAVQHTVENGDSVFSVAERLAGDDEQAVYRLARQIIEINLDRVMPDGETFRDPSIIQPGWVLDLPPTAQGLRHIDSVVDAAGLAEVHDVVEGETLWSIADVELGDGGRWNEVWSANAGREFEGETFDDPDLIKPGWALSVPVDDATVSEALPPVAPPRSAEQADRADAVASNALTDSESSALSRVQPAEVVRFDPLGGENVGEPIPLLADTDQSSPEVLTLGRAAMLAGGVLALLEVRRRRRLRELSSDAAVDLSLSQRSEVEAELRRVAAPERFLRVDLTARAAARQLVGSGRRVAAMVIGDDGAVDVLLTEGETVEPKPPFQASGRCWTLARAITLNELADAGRGIGAPCPLLVQIGVDELDRDVYLDLEAFGAIEVGGSPDDANAIVRALGVALAGSVLAEVSTLVGVGLSRDSLLAHRHFHDAPDLDDAIEIAAVVVSTTETLEESTFDLRVRATAGEAWEPAAILAASTSGEISWQPMKGVALVSAAPVVGPSSRLAPTDHGWTLNPIGLQFRPIGLTEDDVDDIAALLSGVDRIGEAVAEPNVVSLHRTGGRDDVDVVGDVDLTLVPDTSGPFVAEPDWHLMVRFFGPVNVVDRNGVPAEFERAKARELVAWLAAHRGQTTRRSARSALWTGEVRDATFANVVSDARRSLARLAEPPDADWIGRTVTDDLPLAPSVVTDAQLVEAALRASRSLPSEAAIEVLRPAVARIIGVPFDGSGYLWADAEGLTTNLILVSVSASAALAEHSLAIGDIDGVFWATGRGLHVLPGHEELVGLRMRAYARAGDRAGVRAEWESYERVIAADAWSDGEPSPKLVQLRTDLMRAS